jgi:hypothetical protein
LRSSPGHTNSVTVQSAIRTCLAIHNDRNFPNIGASHVRQPRALRATQHVQRLTDGGYVSDIQTSKGNDCGYVNDIQTNKEDNCGYVSDIQTSKGDDCGYVSDIQTNKEDDCGYVSDIQTSKGDDCG